jgi:hypothetical protein
MNWYQHVALEWQCSVPCAVAQIMAKTAEHCNRKEQQVKQHQRCMSVHVSAFAEHLAVLW